MELSQALRSESRPEGGRLNREGFVVIFGRERGGSSGKWDSSGMKTGDPGLHTPWDFA